MASGSASPRSVRITHNFVVIACVKNPLQTAHAGGASATVHRHCRFPGALSAEQPWRSNARRCRNLNLSSAPVGLSSTTTARVPSRDSATGSCRLPWRSVSGDGGTAPKVSPFQNIPTAMRLLPKERSPHTGRYVPAPLLVPRWRLQPGSRSQILTAVERERARPDRRPRAGCHCGPGRGRPKPSMRFVRSSCSTLVGGLPDHVATEFAQPQWRGQALERQHQTGDARLTGDALRHAILPTGSQTHGRRTGRQAPPADVRVDVRQCPIFDRWRAGQSLPAAPVRRLSKYRYVERRANTRGTMPAGTGVQKPVCGARHSCAA